MDLAGDSPEKRAEYLAATHVPPVRLLDLPDDLVEIAFHELSRLKDVTLRGPQGLGSSKPNPRHGPPRSQGPAWVLAAFAGLGFARPQRARTAYLLLDPAVHPVIQTRGLSAPSLPYPVRSGYAWPPSIPGVATIIDTIVYQPIVLWRSGGIRAIRGPP